MHEINLKGIVTSKRAAHVPVIRRWKLVWERREFGTQIDKIDLDIPIRFEGSLSDMIIPLSLDVKIIDGLILRLRRQFEKADIWIEWQKIEVPGTRRIIVIPSIDLPTGLILAWHPEPWKGVKIDIEGSITFKP